MKRQFLLLVFVAVAVGAMACTNFIVGKKASKDGSVICTYNADDYGMFIGLAHYPAAKHQPGEMRQVINWDTHAYGGEIEEALETYNVIGNMNEWQVTIGETTFGGREEMVDTTGILDYGSLIYIALQRSKTAREAIQVMTRLVEKYGYNSEGETFTICDPNEAWIMEMMGCASDRSVSKERTVWVALRIPDDVICGHANQSRISKFDRKDKENVLYSKNVVSYARKMGWYDGKDEDFSFCNTYAFPDFSGRRVCDARVWSFFNRFSDGMERYLPWAEGIEKDAEPMPLWVKPNRKLSVADVETAMRDHYEGTPFALDSDIGGGIWQMPYRPTPLYYNIDGKRYFNERPTSTQQTGFSYVAQMRSWLPRQVGGVLWFGNDDGNMVPYTPVYCCATEAPRPYSTPGADALTFSMENAYWVQNWVSNMVYPRYSLLFPTLCEKRDSLDDSYFRLQKEVEDRALLLNGDARVEYLTRYTAQKADEMLGTWKELAFKLIVKYNDMIVKPERNGVFTRTPEGLGSRVVRPGYPEKFARELLRQTGKKYEIPE
jgi:dipeptidase